MIKHERPPNYDQLIKAFPAIAGKNVIYAYAPYIYTPSRIPLTDALRAHEKVHIARQEAMGVEAWWERYIEDVGFRYTEELLAHRVEYQELIRGASRQVRRSSLSYVAKRLASPLYGKLKGIKQVMADILEESV